MAGTDASTLIKAIREQSKGSYKVISGGKHLKVIHADGPKKGRSVVDDSGPLIISGSPSESRNRELAVHRLMSAGVLQYDPWKGPPRKPGQGLTAEEKLQEQKQQRKLAITQASNVRKGKSDQLRASLEILLVKIGGSWDKWGFKKEMATTVDYWLRERGGTFGMDAKGIQYALTQIAKGNTIAENSRMALEEFVYNVNQQINPRSYYFHLVGLAKDAKPVRQLPAQVTRTDPETGESEIVRIPDPDEGRIESKPSVWDFVGLAAVHERNGLKWSMGLTIDDYAELQRAVGFLSAMCIHYGEEGKEALETLSNFLIKMAEARFYTMMNRDEDPDVT